MILLCFLWEWVQQKIKSTRQLIEREIDYSSYFYQFTIRSAKFHKIIINSRAIFIKQYPSFIILFLFYHLLSLSLSISWLYWDLNLLNIVKKVDDQVEENSYTTFLSYNRSVENNDKFFCDFNMLDGDLIRKGTKSSLFSTWLTLSIYLCKLT